MFIRATAICIGLLVVQPVSAQTPAPAPEQPAAPPSAAPPVTPPAGTLPPVDDEDPRYSFHRVEDGYLRLDTRTGRVALCGRRQVGWACQVLPDDRIVLEGEIARLQQETGVLKKELLSRGIALPRGLKPPPASARSDEPQQPSDSTLDRVMSAFGVMWRNLVEMIADLQRDIMKKG